MFPFDDVIMSCAVVVFLQGLELASSTGQYLSEQTLNAFWIDWTDDLEMGLGYTYGYQMILNASLPGDLDIDRVQMYSPWQDKEGAYEAVWRWGSDQGMAAVQSWPVATFTNMD